MSGRTALLPCWVRYHDERGRTSPDGPITITINAWDNGALIGTQQVVLADGAATTVPLPYDSVDTLTFSAGGKYFALDDLAYFPDLPD